MAFYFCSGSAKKLEKVLIGDITKNSTINMADKGYKASEYTKWTNNNFCFVLNSQSFLWDCHYQDGDGDWVSCWGARITLKVTPSFVYTPETGALKVTLGTTLAESYNNTRIPSKSIYVVARVYLLRWV